MTSAPVAPFGRMLTAMATPFLDDGSLDLDGVQRVAKHLLAHGHDGLVVSGTTGESPTTTTDEDGEVLAAVRAAVGSDVPLVAGVAPVVSTWPSSSSTKYWHRLGFSLMRK